MGEAAGRGLDQARQRRIIEERRPMQPVTQLEDPCSEIRGRIFRPSRKNIAHARSSGTPDYGP
ncbi:hypothetical protein [Methylobacterium nodulans]|uniref:hypothetical protein n=1 Tax=Methylobacterium nodulans TaxID=114616 RepID=UPI0012ECF1F4|nr:hypothetical protein [Methylobacterium nodulans]